MRRFSFVFALSIVIAMSSPASAMFRTRALIAIQSVEAFALHPQHVADRKVELKAVVCGVEQRLIPVMHPGQVLHLYTSMKQVAALTLAEFSAGQLVPLRINASRTLRWRLDAGRRALRCRREQHEWVICRTRPLRRYLDFELALVEPCLGLLDWPNAAY